MAKHNVFDKYDVQKQKDLLVQILITEPPYKSFDFEYDWYIYFGIIENLCIDAFCEKCCGEKVFDGDVTEGFQFLKRSTLQVTGGPPGSRHPSIEEYYKGKECFVNITLHCAKCGEAHYYSLLFKGNTVTKIGQYPSFSKSEVQSLRKYKNLISKYYPELTRSVNAYSQGMGVAAFIYLRRILEYLVESKYNGDASWKFIEKLKEVEKTEEIIPEELSAVKEEIYSVLSKGIHEYEEDECMELYLAVKYVIERMLDLELERKSRLSRANEAMKAIKSKLQENKNGSN